MVRAALIFLVAVGILASMLDTVEAPATGASAPGRTIIVDAGRDASATLGSLESGAMPSGALVLQREPDGHFYADAQINGTTIRMLVDTGATAIALSRDDARRAGVGVSIGMPNIVGQGASGEVRGEFVTLGNVSLGGESAQEVPAIVLDGGRKSLLGQSFLARFASVEIKGDRMVLR